MVRVARDTHRSVEAVAGDSYALTLWTWGHLIAEAQRDRLLRQGDDLELADAIVVGYHEPKKMGDKFDKHADRLGVRETSEEAMSASVRLAAAVTRAAEMDRLLEQQSGEVG